MPTSARIYKNIPARLSRDVFLAFLLGEGYDEEKSILKGVVCMLDPKKKRRIQIIIGISLVFIGILIAFLLIKSEYDRCAYMWRNNENAFGLKYASEWDCFCSRSKAAVIIYSIIGLVPAGVGCFLCIRRPD